MKNLYLLLLVLIGFNRAAQAQTITLTKPVSTTTYSNTLPCIYFLSETPAETKVILTMTDGYYYSTATTKVWTLTMKTNPTNKNFTIYPSLDSLINANYTTNPNNSPIPEGTYSVTAQFKRTSNGAMVSTTSTIAN